MAYPRDLYGRPKRLHVITELDDGAECQVCKLEIAKTGTIQPGEGSEGTSHT